MAVINVNKKKDKYAIDENGQAPRIPTTTSERISHIGTKPRDMRRQIAPNKEYFKPLAKYNMGGTHFQ